MGWGGNLGKGHELGLIGEKFGLGFFGREVLIKVEFFGKDGGEDWRICRVS